MLGAAWLGLLRRIPASQHDALVLVTNNGSEIMIKSLVRLERDFMVVRGRMAGAQDSNKVIIVPFDQVNFLSFNKRVLDEELHGMFGQPGALVETGADDTEQVFEAFAIPEPTTPEPEAAAGPASGPVPTTGPGGKANPISKSLLLARLRARLGKGGPNST